MSLKNPFVVEKAALRLPVCTVAVGSSRFFIHKSILMKHSPVLDAMFKSNKQEGIASKLMMDDSNAEVVELLLAALYGSETCDSDMTRHGFELMMMAHKYQIQPLLDSCSAYWKNHLTVNNAVPTMRVAEFLDLQDLLGAVVDFVVEHGSIVEGYGSITSKLSKHTSQLLLNAYADNSRDAKKRRTVSYGQAYGRSCQYVPGFSLS